LVNVADLTFMRIYISEITEDDWEMSYTQAEPWVWQAVHDLDETHDPKAVTSPRPIQVNLNVRKVDEVVVISGKIDTSLHLICSRCAAEFEQNAKTQFSTLYCKDPVMAGVGYLEKEGKPDGQNQGKARHAHDWSADSRDSNDLEDDASAPSTLLSESGDQSLDITYVPEDFIELKDVLKEQLQFHIPLQPLCRKDCKGICAGCGTDLNQGVCCCKTKKPESPFAGLAKLRLS